MSAWRLGPYRALEHFFVVEGVGCGPVRLRLEQALAPLAAPDDGTGASAYEVTRMNDPDIELYRLTFNSRLVARGQSAFYAAGYVLWHVNQRAVTLDRGRRLILHAAGVERDGVLVLLLGDSGVGKTTTTAGLLRAGFRYLTDEAVALDRHSLTAVAFPKALALNDDVAGMFEPGSGSAELGPRDPVRHLTWRDLGSPGLTGDIAPRLIVALAKPDAAIGLKAGSWQTVKPEDMTLTLAQATFRFRSRPRQNLEAAAELAQSAPAYALVTGDVQRSVEAISAWAESPGAAAPGWLDERRVEPRVGGSQAPEPVPCDPQACYGPARGVVEVPTRSMLVLRHDALGQSIVLGGTAPLIWQGLSCASSVAEIAEGLAQDFDVPVEQVQADVASLTSRLLGLGLIHCTEPY